MNTKQVPKNPDKRRAWIKYQLELVDSSYADIARELGVTRAAVRKATWMSYPKMERAIAKKLGCRPEDLWPERYAA
jgi:Ner family transcriptional regulator